MGNTDPMNGRWDRELTDNEIKRLMGQVSRSGAQIVECEPMGLTFIRFAKPLCAILRTSALGGETYDIHGGWHYSNPFSAELDWNEIETMARETHDGRRVN